MVVMIANGLKSGDEAEIRRNSGAQTAETLKVDTVDGNGIKFRNAAIVEANFRRNSVFWERD